VFTSRPAEAARLLEQAVALSGDDFPEAQLLWTRALLRSGQRDEALGCFSLIAAPSALHGEELLRLADEASAEGAPLLAVLALQAIPEASAQRRGAIKRLLGFSQQAGEASAVAALAQEWAALDADCADPWLSLAQAHEQLQDPPQAAQAYRQFLAREADPQRRVLALRPLARLSLAMGDRKESRELQTELLGIVAPTTADRLQAARLLRMEGDLDAAWSAVQEVLAREPTELAAVELRGMLAFDRQDFSGAVRDLEAVLRQQPWNKAAHYQVAQALQHLGSPEEARRHFDENRRLTDLATRVLELQSRRADGAAEIERLNELSAAYESLGQVETAARLRERMARISNTGR
jgi:predicted Zn-dependent protease